MSYDGEIVMSLREAARYVGYRDWRKFMSNWVRKNKVPYEIRGIRKIFLKSILDKHLVRIAETTARKVYEK